MKTRHSSVHLLTLLFTAVLLSGCGTMYVASYDVGLDAVERPSDATQRYGPPEITRADSAGVAKYQFSDSLITVTWLVLPQKIGFILENKADHSIKIIWDEAAFVDPNGLSMRVMHAGVSYADRNSPQPPTVVAKGGRISDVVHPTDYVDFIYGNWREMPIFAPYSAMTIEALEPARDHVGKTIQILLPIEIEGVTNEYTFTFKVNDVKVPSASA